jgi:photosystem II stability/assembly factor-like uncharacterized protein
MVGGGIAKTTDGGATWISQMIAPSLQAVCFTDTNTGTAVGEGFVFRTTDGGANWTNVPGMTNYALQGVSFTDANAGTAVGYGDTSNTIIHTTDGGTTWTHQSSGLSDYFTLNAVHFLDATTGIAVGYHSLSGYSVGVILRTTNGGSTWRQDPFTSFSSLWAISFLNAQTGMVVGFNGTILRTVNGGLTDVKGAPTLRSAIPTQFALQQNYPNPFNPSTTIRYSVPHQTRVTLAVFNILGQQVALLQNGDQDAGFHEVRFDGSGLASGVYFYRLQAGSYVNTKKLLLLR